MQVTTPSVLSPCLKEGRQLVMQADEGELMTAGRRVPNRGTSKYQTRTAPPSRRVTEKEIGDPSQSL